MNIAPRLLPVTAFLSGMQKPLLQKKTRALICTLAACIVLSLAAPHAESSDLPGPAFEAGSGDNPTVEANISTADMPAEALRREVVAAVRQHLPLEANMTLITSSVTHRLQQRVIRSRQQGFVERPPEVISVSVPYRVRTKTKLQAIYNGFDTYLAPVSGQKLPDGMPAALLSFVCDPFLSHYEKGFFEKNDSTLVALGVHYAGKETKREIDKFVEYRVVEIRELVSSAPVRGYGQASAVVTDWKLYVGPDGLVHRITWSSNEKVRRQQSEVIINNFYHP